MRGGAVGHGTAGFRIDQAGEFLEHLGHLVAALAAADIDDDVGVAPFGELVLGHGLAGAEPSRNRRGAAFGNGEEGIDDPLARDRRAGRRRGAAGWGGESDGPLLAKGELVQRALGVL